MPRFLERCRAFNTEWNDLPRKLLTVVVLLACFAFALWALPFVLPFALAALFSWVINPAVTAAARLFGNKRVARGIVTGVFVALAASALITGLLILSGRLFEEAKSLAQALPNWVSQASRDVAKWLEEVNLGAAFEGDVDATVKRIVGELTATLSTLASRGAQSAASMAWRAVAFLPQGIVFVVLTLMGTFYMSADKDRIVAFLKGMLPERHRQRSNLFRASILRAVLSQLRAALIMLCVTFGELTVGFLLMGLDYAVLFALVIAVLDALPVLGAGLFLLPMVLVGIATGNVVLAVGAGLLYIVLIAVRQTLEPRLIGRQLGLYPLATMMAMYAGLRAMGFIGMLLGPLMLLLCKVALTAAEPAPAARPAEPEIPAGNPPAAAP